MEVDFLQQYVPETAELQQSDVLSTRIQLQDYYKASFNDIATNPGTVIGDLIVTPQSYLLEAFNQGLGRVLSDLLLDNVSEGKIFNCEFVESYLNNFISKDLLNKPSSGVLRLVFSENKQYILDRGTQFRLGDHIFSIYLPNDGDFYCLQSDQSLIEGQNGDILKDTGSSSWFCDVPVIGNTSEVSILAGSQAEISTIIPELQQIYALDEFYSGIQQISLENLAKLAQTTSYSASLNTRAGTVMYVNKFCPFVNSVFPARDGDRELLRTYRNGYGVASGCMDVYVRSQSYQFTEVQQVKLVLDQTGEWLEGDWNYVGQPYHLESITHPGIDLLDLEDREIISSSDPSLGLGALAAYTKNEKLYIRLKNLKDSQDVSLFNLQVDEDTGASYTYVTVTYQTDPMFRPIQQVLENIDYNPINTSIMVRGFIPIIIKDFKIIYVRKPGVIPDLQYAQDQIKIYLGKIGAPTQYSTAEVARIMNEAGVLYIKDVQVDAYVQWSIGDKIQDYQGNQVWTLTTEIRSDDELRVQYPNPDQILSATDMYACTPRILRYFVLEDAIKFKEVRDV